ncbi:DNA-formamidopyrimidine glycosylase family protein, partial [Frankia sp. AvcI1]
MPELPEVEVVRRGLQRGVVGRVIASVAVCHPRAVRRHPAGAGDFAALLVGQRVTAARRRGKYLWLALRTDLAAAVAAAAPALAIEPGTEGAPAGLPVLESPPSAAPDDALIAHLGMSGQLLVVPPTTPDQRHLRIRFTFVDGGRELRFVDQRTFGGLAVAVGGGELPEPVAHIARDPLDPAFDEDLVVRRLRDRRTGVKR